MLITIVIIGVVAAITIPLIVNTYRRIVYPTQLKAVYSKLLVAQKTINDEFGTPEQWQYSTTVKDSTDNTNFEIFKRYATELSAISIKDRFNFNNFKYEEQGLSPNVKTMNGQLANPLRGWAFGQYVYHFCRSMQLKSGATIAIYFREGTAGAYSWPLYDKKMYAAFLIDINGVSPPNIIGRDIFAFGLKGGSSSIVPYMEDTSDCNKQGAGLSCSRKIMEEEWKMNY